MCYDHTSNINEEEYSDTNVECNNLINSEVKFYNKEIIKINKKNVKWNDENLSNIIFYNKEDTPDTSLIR